MKTVKGRVARYVVTGVVGEREIKSLVYQEEEWPIHLGRQFADDREVVDGLGTAIVQEQASQAGIQDGTAFVHLDGMVAESSHFASGLTVKVNLGIEAPPKDRVENQLRRSDLEEVTRVLAGLGANSINRPRIEASFWGEKWLKDNGHLFPSDDLKKVVGDEDAMEHLSAPKPIEEMPSVSEVIYYPMGNWEETSRSWAESSGGEWDWEQDSMEAGPEASEDEPEEQETDSSEEPDEESFDFESKYLRPVKTIFITTYTSNDFYSEVAEEKVESWRVAREHYPFGLRQDAQGQPGWLPWSEGEWQLWNELRQTQRRRTYAHLLSMVQQATQRNFALVNARLRELASRDAWWMDKFETTCQDERSWIIRAFRTKELLGYDLGLDKWAWDKLYVQRNLKYCLLRVEASNSRAHLTALVAEIKLQEKPAMKLPMDQQERVLKCARMKYRALGK